MGLGDIYDTAVGIVTENPIATAIGAAGVGVGVGVGASALVGSLNSKKSKGSKTRRSRKRRGKIKHTSRGWKQDRKRRSKQKWEVAYWKRKRKLKRHGRKSRRGKKGLHYTKNGQPYIILSSGKARFIKKHKGGKR